MTLPPGIPPDPPGTPPNQSSQPDDAAAYLRDIARGAAHEAARDALAEFQAFFTSEIVPALRKSLDDQVAARISTSLTGVPSKDALFQEVTQAVVAQVNAKVDAGFAAMQQNAAGGAPVGPAAAQQPTAQSPSVGVPIGLNIDVLMTYGMKFFEMWDSFEQRRLMRTDPIALAVQLRQLDPLRAAIAGQILSPNPMEQYAPTLAAQVAANTMRQANSMWMPAFKKNIQEGAWPGHGTPSNASPAWYGGGAPPAQQPPGGTPAAPPSTPAPPSGGIPPASMTNASGTPPASGGTPPVSRPASLRALYQDPRQKK